jgi:AcrR family transcriptional regulator
MDRRTSILLAAINLFATKGYHETSMQNIAAESNIAKGTIYSYFHSKDELLLSIINYCHEETKQKLEQINSSSLSAKEKFKKQIEASMEERLKYKDFFMIQHREQTLNSSKQIKEAFLAMQEDKLRWMTQGFIHIYGKHVEKHCFDLSALLDSIVSGFLRIISVKADVISIEDLSDFIISRFDAMVKITLEEEWEPLFPSNYKEDFFDYIRLSSSNKELAYQLKQMVTIIHDLDLAETKKEDYLKTIDFLREEATQKEPRNMILKGVMHELGTVQELAQPLIKIKKILKID